MNSNNSGIMHSSYVANIAKYAFVFSWLFLHMSINNTYKHIAILVCMHFGLSMAKDIKFAQEIFYHHRFPKSFLHS